MSRRLLSRLKGLIIGLVLTELNIVVMSEIKLSDLPEINIIDRL